MLVILNKKSKTAQDQHYAGGLNIKGSPYLYLGRTEKRSKIVFVLTILEREVP
jgi:hypothetical protein